MMFFFFLFENDVLKAMERKRTNSWFGHFTKTFIENPALAPSVQLNLFNERRMTKRKRERERERERECVC